METLGHPYQESYVSAQGSNLEPDWLGRAVCRTTPDASWIFFPGTGEKNGDKEICASCPVSKSCLMDAMTMPLTAKGGRRAGTTQGDRSSIHSDLKPLVSFYALGDGSTRRGRLEFYSNTAEAPLLVAERLRWWDEYSFPDSDRWPTEVAVTIAASVG